MENKVREITEKIYSEGVEKGQAEAQKMIEKAEVEKNDLLNKAKQDAEKIVADARKQADELSKNTQSELALYAARTVETLKSEIADLVTNSVIHTSVEETVTNEWLQNLMFKLASEWITKENIAIQTADAEALTQYFAQQAKKLLDQGLKIEQVNGKPTDFAITPANGSYKVQFGKTEFENYFKEFLRPKLVEMLFKV
jgi:V/A-type H+-transporting ATPase subunit E